MLPLRWLEGFNVHSEVRARTKEEAERIGKCMIRPVLSLERLSFNQKEGKVGYRYRQHSVELDVMDYLESIARVTSHIPDKGQVTVRYYGRYANAHWGRARKAGLNPSLLPMVEEILKSLPSKGWAALAHQTLTIS